MQEQAEAGDISLIDIYDFLAQVWKTLLFTTCLGAGIGVAASYVLPEQFEATALIESAKVATISGNGRAGGMLSFGSNYVEPIAVLAEKMRSPTYYDEHTLSACVEAGSSKGLEDLAKALSANVARNSNFVSVSYRAESRERAMRCLEKVLAVVVSRQKKSASANLSSVLASLENSKRKANELRQTVKKLESDRGAQFRFKNIEYSAAALITVTLQSTTQELLVTENQISAIESMLKPPKTQDAKFATPIFAPERRVFPRLSLAVIFGLVGGLFVGLFIFALGKARASIKKHREEQLP